MAEDFREDVEPQYEETRAPQNPPNSMVGPEARRGWLASSLGTVILIFVVVAAVFTWVMVQRSLGEGPIHRSDPQSIGTSGERMRDQTPGGFNPTPRPGDTQDELELRGAGERPQGPMPGLAAGEITTFDGLKDATVGTRVTLSNVTVESASAGSFVIRDDEVAATVVAPGGMPTVRTGQRVNVSGTIEAAGAKARIRASRIDVR